MEEENKNNKHQARTKNENNNEKHVECVWERNKLELLACHALEMNNDDGYCTYRVQKRERYQILLFKAIQL